MALRKILSWTGRGIALSVLYFIAYVFVQMVWPLSLEQSSAPIAQTMGLLFVVCMFFAFVAASLAYHSAVSKSKMIIGLTVLLFGVITLQAIDESLFFRDSVAIPVIQQFQMLGMGLIRAFLMALFAVWLTPSKTPAEEDKYPWSSINYKQLFIRILAAAVLFPAIYEFCGYFIAWQSPAVQAFYQNGAQIALLPLCTFQVFRGLIWCGLALLALVLTSIDKTKQIIYIGLSIGILHSIQIIVPSAYMPQDVRLVHLIELFVSITAMGSLSTWLLTGRSLIQSMVGSSIKGM